MFRRLFCPRLNALVLADLNGTNQFSKSTFAAINASKQLSKKTTLVIFSNSEFASELAKSAAFFSDQVVLASAPTCLMADNISEGVVALCEQLGDVTHIVGSTSSMAKDVLPRVGALIDAQPVSDVVEILGADSFKRGMYAGNVIASLKMTDKVKIVSIRPTAFSDEVDKKNQSSPSPIITASLSPSRVEFISAAEPDTSVVDLATASVVVAGGRGLKSEENFRKILHPLCDKLKAALGASRAAVDAGFAPNETQIGQTGKVVAPALYIAVGISGAIQHLAGMKDSRTIVAINKDGDAPIFQVADYGLVGDLNVLVPELVQKL